MGSLTVFISASSCIIEAEFGVLIKEVVMAEPELGLGPSLCWGHLACLGAPSRNL